MISAGTMKWTCYVREYDNVDNLGVTEKVGYDSVTNFRAAIYDTGGGEIGFAGGAAEGRNFDIKTRYSTASAAVTAQMYCYLTDGTNTITAQINSIRNEGMKNRVLTFSVTEVLP